MSTESTSLKLNELSSMSRPELAERWQSTFGVPAPKSCQATLLRNALAWDIQLKDLRVTLGARQADRSAKAIRPAPSTLSMGTRLLREWRGRTHHVSVVAGGYEYDGKTWKSLSAIARAITGTRWSGPLFFGVRL